MVRLMSDERTHGAIMNKYIFPVIVIVAGIVSVGTVANAASSTVPDPFQRFDENSKLTIDYSSFEYGKIGSEEGQAFSLQNRYQDEGESKPVDRQ